MSASLISTAEAEMQAAPRVASRTGGGPPDGLAGVVPGAARALAAWRPRFRLSSSLPVMTVLAYGADMGSTLGEQVCQQSKRFWC